jgi:hypothetical protein
MLWSLRSNRRRQVIGLMPRSTTLNGTHRPIVDQTSGFHAMLSHGQPCPSSARNFMLSRTFVAKALTQFQEHDHTERNHSGKNNVLLFPAPAPLAPGRRRGPAVENALAAYSGTTAAPHEYFDQMILRLHPWGLRLSVYLTEPAYLSLRRVEWRSREGSRSYVYL